MNKETGGPAFPDPQEDWRGDKGMTLRDYFAAKAMQGMLAYNNCGNLPNYELVLMAYGVADAMLIARGTEKARE